MASTTTVGGKASPKLNRFDSSDLELDTHTPKAMNWGAILCLAFQSLGVVYGDIGTSLLYVFASTFSDGEIRHRDDVLGVLSLIFYTLTLIPVAKYVFIVLRANDHGNGGTFALYSLICRYAKVGLLPSQQAEDRDVSSYRLQLPGSRLRRASWLKSAMEGSAAAKYCLLLATMLGTAMVIGDGVLTPSISVLSAVGGIKRATTSMTEGKIVWTSVAVLVCLFASQRFGTDKVGITFAPIICLWFGFNACIGVYNFFRFDISVAKSLNPLYIVYYFQRNGRLAWISLGGVVLAITGTEAMFADVGHFSVRSIQISMCTVTYPALLLAYVGQAAFLRVHPTHVLDTFYVSIPEPLYWPMFVVAVLASIIASQAMISGTFSIIQQSLYLGCFPRVKIVHTSTKYEGQVYIPEVNWILMLACISVTIGFKNTAQIGNAYGIAVVLVMLLTSILLVLVMVLIWKTNILLVITYVGVFCSVELLYLSSVLYKFDQGGYLPLAFAALLMSVMYVWNDVYRRKYYYEMDRKISPQALHDMVAAPDGLHLVPGLAIFYSELVHGLPPIFKQYISNVPALHSVMIFVSVKSVPVNKVPAEERFLFRRVGPTGFGVFRCFVRYGYTDVRSEEAAFEVMLVERLKEFIVDTGSASPEVAGEATEGETSPSDIKVDPQGTQEIGDLERAWSAGVVHLIGESEVVAREGASLGKRILIDYAYDFLKRNLRQSCDKAFDIPHKRMLKLGMTYEL